MIRFYKYIFLIAIVTLGISCSDDNKLGGATPISDFITIDEVREVYKGKDITLNSSVFQGPYKTTGVVISNPEGRNIEDNHLILQATDGFSMGNMNRSIGIQISLPSATENTYKMGDSLVIDLTNTKLKKENGDLILEASKSNIVKIKSDCKVIPSSVSINELYSNIDKYNCRLVQILCEIYPLPPFGEGLEGDKPMPVYDAEGSITGNLYLHTLSSATFADKNVMPASDVIGIAKLKDGKGLVSMRTEDDMQNESGPLYTNWPEDFEIPSIEGGTVPYPGPLRSYSNGTNTGTFKTGNWYLFQSILVDPVIENSAGRDRITGKQGIRMQRTLGVGKYGVVEMKFNLPHGATKISYTHGIYYTDAGVQFWLEYSTDSGATWNKLGETITSNNGFYTETLMLDIDGPVRFRIYKPGAAADGRLSIDNIYVYQKTW